MRRKASSCLEALKLHHRVWRHSNSTIVSGGTQTPPSCLEALKLHHRRLRCASTGGRGFSCGVVRAQGSSSLSSTPYYHLVPVLPEKVTSPRIGLLCLREHPRAAGWGCGWS